ncbi:MAG TPA: glycerophosphodiester phosphodiesterase family protein [Fibrobacteria bacterium]|nr:glycerophosphodiester phosphodiesterase family protein [Fibrobacteria bacterium]
MNIRKIAALGAATFLACSGSPARAGERRHQDKFNVQVGPRPYFLVDDMDEGKLKDKLESCSEDPLRKSDFSIGHRGGGTLQYPEETRQSYEAGARMGAGILECDVVFTKDKQLVCRHDQCDLHTTTNILAIPELAAKCSERFTPYDPVTGKAASAKCCTSDITLAEFKSLCGKMDGFNPKGAAPAEYMAGTPSFRTDLNATCGEVLSHKESIRLIKSLGARFTPELKTPAVPMPYLGSTQEDYAQRMIDEYKEEGINPKDVWPQSFLLDDVLYWIKHEPKFGKQAVYLDARVDPPGGVDIAIADMQKIADQGVRIIAPPLWTLLKPGVGGKIVPSEYAIAAKNADLDIITWTLERSGPLAAGGGYYFQSLPGVINNDGDTYAVLDVLARKVGVLGVFSDWSGTVTYYANCMGLK